MLNVKVAWITALGVVILLAPARAGTAPYAVTFQGLWNAVDHPTSTPLPNHPHFSPAIGTTHSDAVSFWAVGETASDGLEHLAEDGENHPFEGIIDPEIIAGRAGNYVKTGGLIVSTASFTIPFDASSDHPLVTLVTMIGPSPDWFVGVEGLSLLDEQDHWINEIAVDLYAYDAGTENGIEFTLFNSDTVPQGVITQLHGPGVEDQEPFVNPTQSIPHMATMTFTLDLNALGDLDGNGVVDAGDINLLCDALGGTDQDFDLTGDRLVDDADADQLILNLLGTKYGDANLRDGVTLTDLGVVATNWERSGIDIGWAQGDFNWDRTVSLGDLGLLASNFGPDNGPVQAEFEEAVEELFGVRYSELVPAPTTAVLMSLIGLVMLCCGRRLTCV